MVSAKFLSVANPSAPVTRIRKQDSPDAVGVPLRVPLLSSVKPAGNLPEAIPQL